MAINTVVRLDNMAGTTLGTKLVSLRYFDGTKYADIQNGAIVKLDSLISRDLYKAVTPAANDPLGKIALVATPEIMYNQYLKNLEDFYNAAGDDARGYIFTSGDVFSVTASGFDTVPDMTTNKYCEIGASTLFKTVSAATNARFELIAIDLVGTRTWYVLRVI